MVDPSVLQAQRNHASTAAIYDCGTKAAQLMLMLVLVLVAVRPHTTVADDAAREI
jgi:hypothetical protein